LSVFDTRVDVFDTMAQCTTKDT